MNIHLRVLHVANFADRIGGGEESLLTLLRHLDREHLQLSLVTPAPGEMLIASRELGIPGFVIPSPPLLSWRMWAPIAAVIRFCQHLRAHRISLVHVHGARGALYAGLACRLTRVPLIWHVRIAAADSRLDWLLARIAVQIVAISESVAGRFAGLPIATPVTVIPNAVDETPFARSEDGVILRRAHGLGDRPVIALVGRVSPEKGPDVLLEALPEVVARSPRVAVLFAGTGSPDYCAQLASRAKSLGVADRCLWLGHLKQVAPVFHAADVVTLPSTVLSSWAEGFGRVLVEAALCGKPVVASRSGGIPEVIRERETGFLVPPGDPPALARALGTLLADPSLRRQMGEAARRDARARFGVTAHCDHILKLYQSIVPCSSCSTF